MTKRFQVGDLVLARSASAARRAAVDMPALVIRTTLGGGRVRLKVGSREWWDNPNDCEKVSE